MELELINKYDLIKEDYLNGMLLEDIAIKYNYNNGAYISYIINKLDIKKRVNLWTNEQIEILNEKYPYETWDVLIDLLKPFTKNQITDKASCLKIKRLLHFWTDEEVNILKDNFNNISMKELIKLIPNKTKSAIGSKAIKLNLTIDKSWTDEEINLLKSIYSITKKKELLELLPNRSADTITVMANSLGLKKDYNNTNKDKIKKFLIDKLKEFAKELGRTPMQLEIKDNKDMPGHVTYNRYFGSYSNACIIANLVPNMCLFGKNKNVLLSKNNDICLSISELIITNYFIDNNIYYERNVLYRDLINDKRCKGKITDWILKDNIIVEFFGMPNKDYYRVKMEEKISICKDNNIKLIEIYPNDINKLDEIFKDYINKN